MRADIGPKKVRQKLHYFGKIAGDPDGQAALALWLDQKDALLSGHTLKVTLRDLANGNILSPPLVRLTSLSHRR